MFIGTVRFGNDHFGAIMGYGDYVIGKSVISRGFATSLAVLITGASQSRQHSKSESNLASHLPRACLRLARAGFPSSLEKMLLCKQEEAGIQLNAEQANWRDDTDDDELEDQELEAHYMYMAQLQQVSPDAADSGPIFDDEPLQKVSNDDHYNVFTMKSTHPEQSKSVHDTYPIEQDAQNVIIDSLDMNYDREEIDQDDDDNDLAKERELLASLIQKLKYFENKNKSLESLNNFFKEANNELSETNNLLHADYKKSEAELTRCNSTEYASQMELECAKARGDLLSYKMDYQKSCNKYTDTINALNQTISKMKNKLSAHQETISILSQQKEAHIKLYKTHEDRELDKVIALENKVKILDNIVYKTGQSVQKINMLNNKS
nr:integrase, catalytic region, zinc finger, CCHC-type, peptidase aspartic, catalytic [Tanacetum cinerariifolium]